MANYVQRVSQTAQNSVAGNDPRCDLGDLVVMSRGLHAVLALHSPIRDRAGRSWCQGCSTRWHRVGWPCATRNAVVRELTHLGALE
ncbi:MAG TPA: hypothetical protein VFX70_15815 [Mycobacteriales bacterium]|nr:hypothetical protein [Mycobacteriales bacterium]